MTALLRNAPWMVGLSLSLINGAAAEPLSAGQHHAGIGFGLTSYDALLPAMQLRPLRWLSLEARGVRYRDASQADAEYWRFIQIGAAYLVPISGRITPRLGLCYHEHVYSQWGQGGLNLDGGGIYTGTKTGRIVRWCLETAVEISFQRLNLQFGLLPVCHIARSEDEVYPGTDPWGPPPWGDVHERENRFVLTP